MGSDSRQWNSLVGWTGCLLLSCWLSSAGGADICDSHWDPYSQCSPPPHAPCAAWYGKNQGIKKVLIPGLASQGRSEFKKQQEVRKSFSSDSIKGQTPVRVSLQTLLLTLAHSCMERLCCRLCSASSLVRRKRLF